MQDYFISHKVVVCFSSISVKDKKVTMSYNTRTKLISLKNIIFLELSKIYMNIQFVKIFFTEDVSDDVHIVGENTVNRQ